MKRFLLKVSAKIFDLIGLLAKSIYNSYQDCIPAAMPMQEEMG